MTAKRLYNRLITADVHGDLFDRHVFAAILSVAGAARWPSATSSA